MYAAVSLAGSRMGPLPPGTWARGPAWVQGFVRWDSGYYLDISLHGYSLRPEFWAFHPGLPYVLLLARTVLPRAAPEAVGFWLNEGFFLLGLAILHRLTRRLFDARIALRASIAYAFSPASFYLSAVYPEALFMLAVLVFFHEAHARRWLPAALAVGVAAAARPQGLVLVPVLPLALAWSRRDGHGIRWDGWTSAPVALAFPLLFSWYAQVQTGDPLRWLHARERYWPGVHWHHPGEALGDVLGSLGHGSVFPALGFGLLVAALAFAAWDVRGHGRRAAYPAYAFAALLGVVYVTYAETGSLLRFLLPVLPLYWATAWPRRTSVYVGLMVLSAGLLMAVAGLFSTWHAPY